VGFVLKHEARNPGFETGDALQVEFADLLEELTAIT